MSCIGCVHVDCSDIPYHIPQDCPAFESDRYSNHYLAIATKIFGSDDRHICVWDFDNTPLEKVKVTLAVIQQCYELPRIFIIESSPNHYHAYSFTAKPFAEIVLILRSTPYVDRTWINIGEKRRFYRVRISPRNGIAPKLVFTLPSNIPDEVQPDEITVSTYGSNK